MAKSCSSLLIELISACQQHIALVTLRGAGRRGVSNRSLFAFRRRVSRLHAEAARLLYFVPVTLWPAPAFRAAMTTAAVVVAVVMMMPPPPSGAGL